MKKILVSTASIATLLKSLMLNKKASVLGSLFAFVLISAGSTSAFAITIKNENTKRIDYKILKLKDSKLIECGYGTVEAHKHTEYKWKPSEACPRQPQNIEISVTGASHVPTFCFSGWNPRFPYNDNLIATVTSKFYGVSCNITTK
jgi:hypothetical protein